MANSGPLTIKDLEAAMTAITKNYGVPTQFLLPPACADLLLKPLFSNTRCVFDGSWHYAPCLDQLPLTFQFRYMPLATFQPRKNIYLTGI